MKFSRGDIVKNTESGLLGVVVDDSFGCCSSDEAPVVFEGVDYSQGTDESLLQFVEKENPIPDHVRCGAGQGDKCCIFLVIGSKGFECQRFGVMRNTIIFKRDMVAKRHPKELYPKCLL